MMARLFPILLAVFWIIADHVTKVAAVKHLTNQSIDVLPVLDWTLAYNPGAAFSFLSAESGWQRWLFSALAIVVSLWLIYTIIAEKSHWLAKLGYGSVLGGAVGNLYDRIQYGYVIDFIHVHYQNHHFPIFNVADSAITIGVIAIIISLLFNKKTTSA